MTSRSISNPARLRALLRQETLVMAPGAYDCIGARTIEQAGFSAVYMTGAGTAATLGYPDYGLVTMSEMVANAGRLASVLAVPLIADADTGYGNELNVTRTVREYERMGVAGIHIEDQTFPKRCGHLDNKTVIPREEYLSKIRAAAAAKSDADFVLIARTDARAALGFEEAVQRMNEALAAGADMAFLEAPESVEEVAAVPKLVRGPCLLNMVPGGKTPLSDIDEAERLGFKLAILPGLLFGAALDAFDKVLAAVKSTRRNDIVSFSVKERFRRVGADEWDPLRERFKTAAPSESQRRTAAE